MFLNFLGKFNFNPHSEIFFFVVSVKNPQEENSIKSDIW